MFWASAREEKWSLDHLLECQGDLWIYRRADAIWTAIINVRCLAMSMLFREYALRILGKGKVLRYPVLMLLGLI